MGPLQTKRTLPRATRLCKTYQYDAVRTYGISKRGSFFRLSCFHPSLTSNLNCGEAACEGVLKMTKIDEIPGARSRAEEHRWPWAMGQTAARQPGGRDERQRASQCISDTRCGEQRSDTVVRDFRHFQDTLCGIVVSRRVGGAVVRNKIRRRLRDLYRHERTTLIPGLWVVIVATSQATTASMAELRAEWARLGTQLSIFQNTL